MLSAAAAVKKMCFSTRRNQGPGCAGKINRPRQNRDRSTQLSRTSVARGHQRVSFPGRNHGSLDDFWGPEEEGWHFGILNFGSKWESSAVILVECHGKRFRQIDSSLRVHAPRIRRRACYT